MKNMARWVVAVVCALLGIGTKTAWGWTTSVVVDGCTNTYSVVERVEYNQTNEYATLLRMNPMPSGDYTVPAQLEGRPVIGVGSYDRSGCFSSSALTSIRFPETLEGIGQGVFFGCRGLTNVVLPARLESIGTGAFSNCTALSEIALSPTALERIGNGAFASCGLTHVEIPDSVTTIGQCAFWGCSNLTSAVLPGGLTNIPAWLFSNCTNLVSANIPAGVRTIGRCAFNVCPKLKEVDLPGGLTSIDAYGFSGCKSVTRLLLPTSLTNLGEHAFDGAGIRDLVVPGSVKTISVGAFQNCVATNLVVGEGIATIRAYAFYNCNFLKTVTFPESLKTIDYDAFQRCGFQKIEIPEGVTYMGAWVFHEDWNLLEMPQWPSGVATIPAGTFDSCWSMTNACIPMTVTSIQDYAFRYCSNLVSVSIADGVTNIGESVFSRCTSLTSLSLPNTVTNIGKDAFESSGLKTLYVPAAWEGTSMLDGTGLPSGCRVVYGSGGEEPPGEATATTPVAVPHAWLEEKAPGILAAAGGDYEAAATAMASNGTSRVWECYLQGVEPEDAEDSFRLRSRVEEDGEVILWWEPDLGAARRYALEGVEKMGDEWGATNAATRFYRARVSMP